MMLPTILLMRMLMPMLVPDSNDASTGSQFDANACF